MIRTGHAGHVEGGAIASTFYFDDELERDFKAAT
jgi:hypothetical protein